MKYFGTDGIRGVIDNGLDKKLILKVAKALVSFYQIHNLKPLLIVGNDSRISSDYILNICASVLLKHGIEIHNVGICSSPALAYLTRKFNYPLGMMISASHNPSEYNGIKFFNAKGEKISFESEEELSNLISNAREKHNANYVRLLDKHTLINSYIEYIKSIKKCSQHCIIDCANGGTSEIAKLVFKNANLIYSKPDGTNINRNCGCTNIELLRLMCIKSKTIAVSLDGDGDRVHMISESGQIINGDKLLYILSKYYLNSKDKIVGTIYTNTAIEKALAKNNITLVRATVGDKNVLLKMKEENASIGGESSGHIVIKKYTNTGDGLLVSIIIMNIMQATKKNLDELLDDYTDYHRLMENIKLESEFELTNELKNLIKKYEKENFRIIIRPSGTEPVLRIMVEHKDRKKAENCLNLIKKHIKLAKN